jgi:hypothetical protein
MFWHKEFLSIERGNFPSDLAVTFMILEEAQQEPGQACLYTRERYGQHPSFRVAAINRHAFDYSCRLVYSSSKFCSGKDVML